jgi:hypothetical protein
MAAAVKGVLVVRDKAVDEVKMAARTVDDLVVGLALAVIQAPAVVLTRLLAAVRALFL